MSSESESQKETIENNIRLAKSMGYDILNYNPNPKKYELLDCAVRACCAASNPHKSYKRTQQKMNRISLNLCTPYTTIPVISKFLEDNGYVSCWLAGSDDTCEFTTKDVLEMIPGGKFLIETDDHICFINDHKIYDYYMRYMFDVWLEDKAPCVHIDPKTISKCLFCPYNNEIIKPYYTPPQRPCKKKDPTSNQPCQFNGINIDMDSKYNSIIVTVKS